jgi:DNA-binding response OmpR family regulator
VIVKCWASSTVVDNFLGDPENAIPQGLRSCTEDDPDTRELIVLTLTNASYEAHCADNALAALAAAKKRRFDLYLIDTWMPGVSGDDLCKTLREFDSVTPILFYSGAASEADKARAFAAGAQGYLVKPRCGEDLVAEVARLITASKAA